MFWCDSLIVLGYINNKERRFQTFVANRIAVINDASTPEQWRYVPTKENAADDATRGLKANEITGRWTSGPDFLWKDESAWPQTPVVEIPVDDPEVKRKATTCLVDTECHDIIHRLFTKYSKWHDLKKGVAWLRKFISWMKGKRQNIQKDITVADLHGAETAIVRCLQRKQFQNEIVMINASRKIPRSSRIRALEPFLDEEDILRVGGRLSDSSVHYERKHPIILPRDHYVTSLVIKHYHETTKHAGTEYVLSRLRDK